MSFGTELEHWPRWVKASVAKHFDERRQGVKLFVEGDDRDIDEEHEGDIFELRMDGPDIKRFGASYETYVDVEINLLVASAIREGNVYHFDQLLGIGAKIFIDCIKVYRYGNNKDINGIPFSPVMDTDVFLGNLHPKHNRPSRDWLEVNPFGQIRSDIKIQQATIEGHYRMELDTRETDT